MAFNSTQFGLLNSDVIGLTPAQRTAVELQATVSIVARGSQLYENLKYPRFKNFYGYAQVMSGAYVVRSVALEYLNQEILWWRDESVGINETTGCYAKSIALLVSPATPYKTNTVLTRQRYTGIRIRLAPTVQANLGLTWETFEAKCDGNILPPDPKQGEPIPPNNSSSNPSDRPGDQGGDNSDRSANDGNYDPNSGLPKPPDTNEGSSFPCWHYYGQGTKLPGCTTYSFGGRYDAATDRNIVPTYIVEQQNPPCPQATDGRVQYGGAVIDHPSGVIDIGFNYY